MTKKTNYAIKAPESEIVYIGSTKRPLKKRLSEHKHNTKNKPLYDWLTNNPNVIIIELENQITEKELIRQHEPIFNISYTPKSGKLPYIMDNASERQ